MDHGRRGHGRAMGRRRAERLGGERGLRDGLRPHRWRPQRRPVPQHHPLHLRGGIGRTRTIRRGTVSGARLGGVVYARVSPRLFLLALCDLRLRGPPADVLDAQSVRQRRVLRHRALLHPAQCTLDTYRGCQLWYERRHSYLCAMSGRLLAFSRRSRSRRTRAIGWLSTNIHQTRRRWRWFPLCLRSNRSCRSRSRRTRAQECRAGADPRRPHCRCADSSIMQCHARPDHIRGGTGASADFRQQRGHSGRRRRTKREEQCVICQDAIVAGAATSGQQPCSHCRSIARASSGGSETGSTGFCLFHAKLQPVREVC